MGIQIEQVMQQAAELALPLTRKCEGLFLVVYKCPAGIWTQGYGTVNKPDGTKVKRTDPPISKETAEEWLVHELINTYMAGVIKLAPNLVKYPFILAAISDWAYNCGLSRFKASTLRRKIIEEDWEEVIVNLRKWVRGGGRKLPGLVIRRELEISLLQKQFGE